MAIEGNCASDSLQVFKIPHQCEQIALCGGPYSNFAAVEQFLAETADVAYRFCLGDVGGFGPQPDRTIELLKQAGVICLQGNYDDAVGNGLADCGCGYADPRDRHFAQLSYDYTYTRTAPHHRVWMQTLPTLIQLQWRDRNILLCHGSPDKVNEFVWESETDDAKILDYLQRYGVEGICATHSGLPWLRQVARPSATHQTSNLGFWFNVGVLGRPANTGNPAVTYGLLSWPDLVSAPKPHLQSMTYDVSATVSAMRREGLPEAFIESLETGIWTTCAEILPTAERREDQRLAAVRTVV
ncbi:MAG: metallophosphoesterase [Cyanobacteria bacterium J06623_5]